MGFHWICVVENDLSCREQFVMGCHLLRSARRIDAVDDGAWTLFLGRLAAAQKRQSSDS